MGISRIANRIPGRVGQEIRKLLWTRGTQLLVDIVDSCPGACKSCPVGIQPRRDGHRMDIDLFRRILDKVQMEANVYKIQLYRWSDPLIHPQVHRFVEECNKRGIRASTSSFLQATNCEWDKLVESGVDEFRVSFSGWQNMHIYQKPATAERFIKKFEQVASLPWPETTKKTMFFHKYKGNLSEVDAAYHLAANAGFKFVALPATFMLYDRIVNGSYTEEDKETIALLCETPEENIARHRHRPKASDYCSMQEDEIVLDSRGRMQLCQMMYPPEFKVGSYLDEPLADIRKRIMRHPMCVPCKAKGVVGYALCYEDPAISSDPVGLRDKQKY